MLCAKYNYKMDIAVKKEEAFQDGMEAGLVKGSQQKAIETARNFIKMALLTNEQIAQGTGLPIEEINVLTDEIRKNQGHNKQTI